MSYRRSSIIKTAHGARVRYDHGDNCAECRALGPGELEAIVRDLAACRINAATPEALSVTRERAKDWVAAHPVSGDPPNAVDVIRRHISDPSALSVQAMRARGKDDDG